MMAKLLTLAELSRQTGEPVEELRRWQQLGLLHDDANGDFSPDSTGRVRLIQFARARGMEAERIAMATADQPGLLSFFQDQLLASEGPEYTLVEAADRAGVDSPLAERVLAAAGLYDQTVFSEEDVDALRSVAIALQTGLPSDALVQLIRVYADTLGRVAEAETRLFHLYVHEQFRAQGLVGSALLDATHQVSEPLRALTEPTVVYFYRKAWNRAALEDLLLHLCEDTTAPGDVVGQMTSTVMFIDLANFTPLTMVMGDSVAAQVVDRFGELVRKNTAGCGGRIVKQIGDAFMIVFIEASDAVACGLAIEEAVGEESQFPAVHIGAHTGQLLYREGDYLGNTVNIAARVAAEAGPHQLLVSESLRTAAGDQQRVEFVSLGTRQLKGIADAVELFEARRAGRELLPRLLDPVCGMELRAGDEHARLVWQGQEVAFCSADCLQRFLTKVVSPGTH
jgi:adenylate cyclase